MNLHPPSAVFGAAGGALIQAWIGYPDGVVHPTTMAGVAVGLVAIGVVLHAREQMGAGD